MEKENEEQHVIMRAFDIIVKAIDYYYQHLEAHEKKKSDMEKELLAKHRDRVVAGFFILRENFRLEMRSDLETFMDCRAHAIGAHAVDIEILNKYGIELGITILNKISKMFKSLRKLVNGFYKEKIPATKVKFLNLAKKYDKILAQKSVPDTAESTLKKVKFMHDYDASIKKFDDQIADLKEKIDTWVI